MQIINARGWCLFPHGSAGTGLPDTFNVEISRPTAAVLGPQLSKAASLVGEWSERGELAFGR